jgi:hypothetical protein
MFPNQRVFSKLTVAPIPARSARIPAIPTAQTQVTQSPGMTLAYLRPPHNQIKHLNSRHRRSAEVGAMPRRFCERRWLRTRWTGPGWSPATSRCARTSPSLPPARAAPSHCITQSLLMCLRRASSLACAVRYLSHTHAHTRAHAQASKRALCTTPPTHTTHTHTHTHNTHTHTHTHILPHTHQVSAATPAALRLRFSNLKDSDVTAKEAAKVTAKVAAMQAAFL